MKARQKCPVKGPTTCCWTKKEPCIKEKKRIRCNLLKGKLKPKKDRNIHTQTQKYGCWYVWLYPKRNRIRVRYYFTNLSNVTVCLPVHTVTQTHTHTHTQATLKTQANTCQGMIENQHFHLTTVPQHSVTGNTHSPKQWKIGKNVRWQGRQLVDVQIKLPV